jgi:hypothetical protein
MEVFANLVSQHCCEHLLRTGAFPFTNPGAMNDADAPVPELRRAKMESAASSSSTYNEAVLIRAEEITFLGGLRTKTNFRLYNVGASNLIIL